MWCKRRKNQAKNALWTRGSMVGEEEKEILYESVVIHENLTAQHFNATNVLGTKP